MHSRSESVKFAENYGGADTYLQAVYHTFETPLINEEYVKECGGYVLAQERIRVMFGDRAVDASLEDSESVGGGCVATEDTLPAPEDSLRVDADFEQYAPLESEREVMQEIASLPYPKVCPVRYSPMPMRIPASKLRRMVSRVTA
jgi:hypothetical protein